MVSKRKYNRTASFMIELKIRKRAPGDTDSVTPCRAGEGGCSAGDALQW